MVPTDDGDVKTQLRELEQPICERKLCLVHLRLPSLPILSSLLFPPIFIFSDLFLPFPLRILSIFPGLFGEGPAERRDRLRDYLSTLTGEGVIDPLKRAAQIKEEKEEVGQDVYCFFSWSFFPLYFHLSI